MVTRSRAREGRDVNTVPEIEFRPEMVIPAETCEGGLGAARPFTTDIADQYITADTSELVISQGITTSQEASSSFSHTNTQTARAHTDPDPPAHNTHKKVSHCKNITQQHFWSIL